jgi:hypothetical protein
MKIPRLISLFAVSGLVPLAAQDPSLSRRGDDLPLDRALTAPANAAAPARTTQDAPSSTKPGVDLYGDQEILRRAAVWEPWSLSSTTAYEWQTNPALSATNELDGFIFRQSATVRYQHQWSETFYTDASFQGQLFRYDEFDTLDFDRLDGRAGLLWVTPSTWTPALANWLVTAHGTWYRLSDGGDLNDELFEHYGLAFSLTRLMPLTEVHQLIVSLSTELSLDATVDSAQRDEYLALVAWQARWSPQWESVVALRAAFYDYDGHDDVNYGASASLDRLFGSSVRLGLVAGYTRNDSDVSSFDYENTTLGVSLRGQLTF